MEWGAPCGRTVVRAWPNEHSQRAGPTSNADLISLPKGRTRWHERVSNPEPLDPESYALPAAPHWLAWPTLTSVVSLAYLPRPARHNGRLAIRLISGGCLRTSLRYERRRPRRASTIHATASIDPAAITRFSRIYLFNWISRDLAIRAVGRPPSDAPDAQCTAGNGDSK